MGGEPLITIENAGKRFVTGVEALGPASLTVPRGAFLSLVGPSGCGKSTLLRLIAGLDTPTSGHLHWHGQRPRLGFVFQEPTLMPWATVEKNARLGLELLGTPEAQIRETVAGTLDLVGLSQFAKAYPRELSGGMRMRVSIARALAVDPQVLLMDEPFAALDEFTRERLNDELLMLWARRGLTVIFVTHSVYESVYLSTAIAVFTARPGRVSEVVAVDAPQPRGKAFRQSARYHTLCEEVSQALRSASGLEELGE
ncbi:MAG TPA: hypothetical protein DCL54_01615 [Alphaproteobacteria bacterium]|nr:hypothetical protein [Alphaproteobacteria bacterium]